MDCTYKTNRFNMPLLNMVGVTGMNTTIHLAQAFVRSETFENCEWVLRQLQATMEFVGCAQPQVIFIDCDLALLNALEAVFPTVPALLCLWHVIKDVEAHARANGYPQVLDEERSTPRRPKWRDSQAHHNFCDEFVALTRSSTEEEYEGHRRRLQELSPSEAEYVDHIWLDIWKRRIVRCWTDRVLHFGIRTTSRVVGYHSTLKRWLTSSRGDLLSVYNRMVHWWLQSIRRHLERMPDTQVRRLASLSSSLVADVDTHIHNYALLRCLDQLALLGSTSCSGAYTRTTGLPCVHRLRDIQNSTKARLHMEDFHAHWWVV